MSELVSVQVVGTEFEADAICGLLRDAEIECTHQISPELGMPTLGGMPGEGPRVVLVRADDAERAREVLASG